MRKTSNRREVVVCLLSQHVLATQEISRRLHAAGFGVRNYALRSLDSRHVSRFALPAASLYIVDAPSLRPIRDTLIAALFDQQPDALVIVLAEHFGDEESLPLLTMGVRGFLTYDEARSQLTQAVGAVLVGGYWVKRALLLQFVQQVVRQSRAHSRARGNATLSPREQQVFDALLQNLSNKEIAVRLNISERTAKFHVSNVLAKFGVRRRADLIILRNHAA